MSEAVSRDKGDKGILGAVPWQPDPAPVRTSSVAAWPSAHPLATSCSSGPTGQLVGIVCGAGGASPWIAESSA